MTDRSAGYTEYQFATEFDDRIVSCRERQDVAFFVELAQATGGPVLEAGCGTGRVLIPTARAGYEITGLDLSSAMLAVCRANLAAEPVEVQARVQLVEADMGDFDLGRTFGLITIIRWITATWPAPPWPTATALTSGSARCPNAGLQGSSSP